MKRILLTSLLVLFIIFVWLFQAHERRLQTQSQNDNGDSGQNSSASNPLPPRIGGLKDLIAGNDVEVNFYGKVTDQEGNPLEDVKVSWSLIKSVAFAPSLGFSSGSHGVVKTDAAGNFSILHELGLTLSIESLRYSGYHRLMRNPCSYGYRNAEPHEPDPNSPVRFVMVKDGGVRSRKLDLSLKFDWDGLSHEFGTGPEGFPNKIILTPTRQPLRPGERIHDWKLVIKVQDGQIMQGVNDGNSVAPTSGYFDEIVLEKDSQGQRGDTANALIYLKTNSGIYAELRLSAYSDRGIEDSATGYVDIRWNPDGGRVFE